MQSLTPSQLCLLILASICLAISVFEFSKRFRAIKSKQNIRAIVGTSGIHHTPKGRMTIEDRALLELEKSSWTKQTDEKLNNLTKRIENLFSQEKQLRLAGLAYSVTGFGIAACRIKFAVLLSCCFCLIGVVVSAELAVIGFVLGAFFGFQYPAMFLKKRIATRSEELEKHLPEMLEILSISMRSGLSFDRSLEIYCENFDTSLSHDFSNAQKLWVSGIKSRDDALREITKSYDSMIFSRTVEALIRNLRLGTSVASSLLASSKEARAIYQSRREETVRKAPIKMMIPTGTLILPAMLLLIMGPVILELVGGGV